MNNRAPPATARPRYAAPRRLTCRSVRLPVARIEEIVSDGAEAQLRDERHDSLVVVAADHLADARDQLSVESVFHELCGSQAPIDHVVQDEVSVGVGEAELALVGLSRPELRGRRLAHDRLRDT